MAEQERTEHEKNLFREGLSLGAAMACAASCLMFTIIGMLARELSIVGTALLCLLSGLGLAVIGMQACFGFWKAQDKLKQEQRENVDGN